MHCHLRSYHKIMKKHKEIDKWELILNKIAGCACQYHLTKLQRLDNILKGINTNENEIRALQGWCRDDSFLGIPAANEIEYKLGGPLISLDGTRAYEFLIEFCVNEPNAGIYYGVKGLTLEGDHYCSIDQFVEDFWGMKMEGLINKGINKSEVDSQKAGKHNTMDSDVGIVRNLIAKCLNHTFPGKDFSKRFMFTDNALDYTFWPFWIAAEPEEDLVWETARAVSIIRRIYKERADSRRALFELSDPDCPISEDLKKKLMSIGEVKSPQKESAGQPIDYRSNVRSDYVKTIRFTNQAYNSIITKLGNDENRKFFNQLINDLTKPDPVNGMPQILKESTLLEKGFEIQKGHNGRLAKIMRIFFEYLPDKTGLKYKKIWDLFEDIPSICHPYDFGLITQKNLSNHSTFTAESDADEEQESLSQEKAKLEQFVKMAKARSTNVIK